MPVQVPPVGYSLLMVGPEVSPANIILEAAKRFQDRWGAESFFGRELLREVPVSSATEASRCGGLLMEAGLVDEAEALYLAMVQSFPDHPSGFVGLAQVARRRENWTEALERWDSILAAFDGVRNASWLSARAMVLFELGRSQEAADILADLMREFPDNPSGYVGRAQLALRQRFWQVALDRCNEILSRFGDHAGADDWRLIRVGALLELGRATEAETILRDAVDRAPGSVAALLRLLRVYATTGRPEVALQLLETSPLREIESSALVERRLEILIRLNRIDEAGATFERLLGSARRPEVLSSLFAFVPAIYEVQEHQRMRAWATLQKRSTAIRSSLKLPDRVRLDVLNARILLALRDREGVIAAMRGLAECSHLGEHGESMRRVAAVLSEPRYPDYAKPKLFGIGLSKTGTTTLAAALTLLGFNTLHWFNPLTCELISEADIPIFDAFTETPFGRRGERYYNLFPNSKFILTTRPFESWLASLCRHLSRHVGISDFDEIKAALESGAFPHWPARRRFRYLNFRNYREVFEAHEKRVRRFLQDKPADRFLELDFFTGDGWPKLCAFLGRDVPSVPFPWENRGPSPAASEDQAEV